MSNASSKTKPAEPAKKPSTDTVGWGPAAAIWITIAAFVCGQLLAGLLAGLIPVLLGWQTDQVTNWLGTTTGQFIFVLLAEALTLGVVWFFLHSRKISLKALGFHRRPIPKDLAYAGLGFVVYIVLLVVVTNVSQAWLGVNVDEKQELGFDSVSGHWQLLMTFISLVVLPPIAEETVFRGLLYTGLRRKLTFVWATAVTSILFALPHLLTGGEGVLLWVAAIDTLVLSVVLCYVREKTGNLWACIAIHALKNCVAFLFLFVFVS